MGNMKVIACIFTSWFINAASVLGDVKLDTLAESAMARNYKETGDLFGDEDFEIAADSNDTGGPTWTKVEGKKMIDIATSAGNKHVFGLDEDHNLWHRGGIYGEWEKLESPGTLKDIDVNGDGTAIWAVDNKGGSWLRQGYDAEWEKLSGFFLSYVSVSADSVNVWGINSSGVAYWRPGKSVTSYWQVRAGAVTKTAVSGDGGIVWAVNGSGDTFCWDLKKAGGFSKGKGNWQAYSRQYNIGIKFKNIDVAADGSIIYATSYDNELYTATDCFDPQYLKQYKKENGGWTKVEGGKAAKVSVTGYGDYVWAIDGDNDVWYIHNDKE